MLKRNQASLAAQTDGDWEQTFLIDQVGLGIDRANESLGEYAPQLKGRYIWILDDDDKCIRPTLVAELKAIVAQHQPQPDVVMIQMDHGPRGILPDDERWGLPPEQGGIGISAYVVKWSVWQYNAWAWTPGVYHGDYNFIATVFAGKPTVYWHKVIASRVQQISLGKREGTMRVVALNSFVGRDALGNKHRIEVGQEFDLPPGVDWVTAGLATPVALTPTLSQGEREVGQAVSKRAGKREKR